MNILFCQVIGLHKNGYGRILAECMFTSKILYCYWACLAEDDDNFVVETNKPLPNEHAKKIMKEKIIGKSNEEIAQVQSRIIGFCNIRRSRELDVLLLCRHYGSLFQLKNREQILKFWCLKNSKSSNKSNSQETIL